MTGTDDATFHISLERRIDAAPERVFAEVDAYGRVYYVCP